MDRIVYNALSSYYNALEKKGYVSYPQMEKLLILCFYHDFVGHDYRGILSREDYLLIEQALDCLYGTTCLIPYPDYLKMGKLHLAEITELAYRIEQDQQAKVLKSADLMEADESDIMIVQASNEEE